MSTPRLRVRPRFELSTKLSVEEVRAQVEERMARAPNLGGLVQARQLELLPRGDAARFWSPQLTAHLEEDRHGGTRLCCRFGPAPHVWTLYLAIHAIGAMSTLGAAILGYSQYVAGEPPWGLWALPAAPFLAALVWALAFVGQSLGAEQMYGLRRFLEEAVAVHR